MRTALPLLGLVLASHASAAAPVAPDWWLVGVSPEADNALVIDRNSVRDRRGGKEAKVAVIYDTDSEIAAVEMTIAVDCVASRERARSVLLHDQAGRVFKQGASARFEPAATDQPWRRYLCPGPGAGKALASLGPAFPIDAARRSLGDPAMRAAQVPGQAK